jgi:hypothetical protein
MSAVNETFTVNSGNIWKTALPWQRNKGIRGGRWDSSWHFPKIAASSFAAVRSTLQRRLLMLTVYEAVLRDQEKDIERGNPL